jgi:hypothetical protein
MEDARFVRFTYEDGSVTYFATYTAYDGYRILPQLIETRDFISFRVSTLNGSAAVNKGIALFPRKIGGASWRWRAWTTKQPPDPFDNVRFWHDRETLQEPQGSLGGDPARQLRLAARDRGRLARDHARRGPFRRYCLARCCSTSTIRRA